MSKEKALFDAACSRMSVRDLIDALEKVKVKTAHISIKDKGIFVDGELIADVKKVEYSACGLSE